MAITDPPSERDVARIAFLEARLAVLARRLARSRLDAWVLDPATRGG